MVSCVGQKSGGFVIAGCKSAREFPGAGAMREGQNEGRFGSRIDVLDKSRRDFGVVPEKSRLTMFSFVWSAAAKRQISRWQQRSIIVRNR